MTPIKPILFSLVFLASAAITADAVPARPGLLKVAQADGTSLEVRLVGDEHCSMYLTDDGCPLLHSGGNFYYARIADDGNLVSTGVKASPRGLRGDAEQKIVDNTDIAGVDAFFSARYSEAKEARRALAVRKAPARVVNSDVSRFRCTDFPVTGSPRTLVILVRYQDVDFSVPDPLDYFTRFANEEGFSDNGATGSARDYYTASSNGAFTPQFDVYGPVTLAHERAYYGGGEGFEGDDNAWQMVTEACEILDDEIDFSQYDLDGDGYVDNIYVIYAGVGQASSGLYEAVWPFSSSILYYNDDDKVYAHDGVALAGFATSNEWVDNHPAGIGTLVHEFSHVLGLPDLYPVSTSHSFYPGEWSLLATGTYNNEERTPPMYSSFERYCMGWIQPEIINKADNAVLAPLGANSAYMVPTLSADEFYLFENRQLVSWDAYLPAHGMLVWHIDFDRNLWDSNCPNDDSSHQRVDIVEADGNGLMSSAAGDTFPGTSGKTSFTDDTNPSMVTWRGERLGLPLTEISETDHGFVSFKVLGGMNDVPVPGAPVVKAFSGTTATIEWEPVEGADDYIVSVMKDDGFFCVPGLDAVHTVGAARVVITGLTPGSDYRCCVSAVCGSVRGVPSEFVGVHTGDMTFADCVPVALDAADITDSSFQARWEALDEADFYTLSVYVKEKGEPYYVTEGFDNGVTLLPDGWSSSSKMNNGMASYAGVSVPSLKLSVNGDYIETCDYPDGVRSLSFWHRGSGVLSEKNSLRIYGRLAEGWSEIGTCQVVSAEGGQTIDLPQLPAGYTAIRIEYIMESNASVAIDDICVGYGSKEVIIGLDGYENLNAGNATSASVENLAADSDYYYTVSANSGTVASLRSNEVAVRTLSASSVKDIAKADGSLRAAVTGSTIRIESSPAAKVTLLSVAGIVVATAEADESGRAVVCGVASGAYLLTDGTHCIKVLVR